MHTSSPHKSCKHKLLALDLDGTVLNSQHTISQELIDAIKSIAKDTHVVIVTGRHHVAAKPYYEQLGLSTPIICCNGTYIFDYQTNTVLEENAIDKQMAAEFITLSQAHDLKMVMYVRGLTSVRSMSSCRVYGCSAYQAVLVESRLLG